MENAINAVALEKSFGSRKNPLAVIRKLDFTLGAGRFEAIMGASGSGKSTLLHLFAGLLQPDSGSIKICGTEIAGLSDREMTIFRRRKIGLVFQDFNLVETLTAEENIALPQMLDGGKSDTGLLRDVMETLGLWERRSHLPAQLSGGERQRVAIARALAINPTVVLADEPTGNLDFPTAQDFCEVLRTLNEVTKCAILLVSHDPMVAAYAERIHVLKDGAITDSFDSEKDSEKVYHRYLKAMNLKDPAQ